MLLQDTASRQHKARIQTTSHNMTWSQGSADIATLYNMTHSQLTNWQIPWNIAYHVASSQTYPVCHKTPGAGYMFCAQMGFISHVIVIKYKTSPLNEFSQVRQKFSNLPHIVSLSPCVNVKLHLCQLCHAQSQHYCYRCRHPSLSVLSCGSAQCIML